MAHLLHIHNELKALCTCFMCKECKPLAALPDCGHTICMTCLSKLTLPKCPRSNCGKRIRRRPKCTINALRCIVELFREEEDDKIRVNTTNYPPSSNSEDITLSDLQRYTNPPESNFPEHFLAYDKNGQPFKFRLQ